MKKFLSFAVAFAMLLSAFPIASFAAGYKVNADRAFSWNFEKNAQNGSLPTAVSWGEYRGCFMTFAVPKEIAEMRNENIKVTATLSADMTFNNKRVSGQAPIVTIIAADAEKISSVSMTGGEKTSQALKEAWVGGEILGRFDTLKDDVSPSLNLTNVVKSGKSEIGLYITCRAEDGQLISQGIVNFNSPFLNIEVKKLTADDILNEINLPYNIEEGYEIPKEIYGKKITWSGFEAGKENPYITVTAAIENKTKDFEVMIMSENEKYAAAYTTDESEAVGKSLHLALKDSDGWHTLNFGMGVLFPRADLEDGTSAGTTRVLEKPWLYRADDGKIRVAAKVRKAGEKEGEKITLWETENLVDFEKIGETDAASGYENAERVYVPEISGNVSGIIQLSEDEADALEKKLGEVKNTSVEPIRVDAKVGDKIELPNLTANYSDGSTEDIPVDWFAEEIEKIDTRRTGIYTVHGTADVRDYAVPMIGGAADPVVYNYKGKYYFVATNESGGQVDLYIRSADTIMGLADAQPSLIFEHTKSGDHSGCNWAPELHEIGGELYCLFASSTTGQWNAVQSRIMKCTGDPMKREDWEKPQMVLKKDGSPLIDEGITLDMTYFEANGRHYYAWAHRPIPKNGEAGNSTIAIAEIDPENPYRITTEPVIIRTPDFGWDRRTAPVDEGPNVLKHEGKLYMTFSGSGVGDTYCLGLMTADEKADLLKPESWVVTGYPVQSSEHFIGQLGPGHNSFVKDERGRDTIIYHMMPNGGTRSMTAATIHYAFDGTPVFYMTAERYLKPEYRNVTATVVVGDGKTSEDEIRLEADADALSFLNPDEITADLMLSKKGALSGAEITWKSSDKTVITDDGKVTRQKRDEKVTMTATLKLKGYSATRDIELTVLGEEEPAAYLFAYFTGNAPKEERLFYGVSRDGCNFRALNAGGSVLTSNLGTGCIRDPFVFKGEDGYYYIVATDMRSSLGWSSNYATVVFKTPDLINIVDSAYIDYRRFASSEGCTRAWAPQVIWCEEKDAYMIYLAMEIPKDPYPTVMYRQYAKDLCDISTYTEPELMLDEPVKGAAAIDGDIIYDELHKKYIMYYDGKRVATSDTLSGNWSYSEKILPMYTSSGEDMAVEGSNIWKIIGEDKWVIAADGTAFNGGCYALVETTDFENYTQLWEKNGDYSFDFTPRHGYVIPISERELDNLIEKYGAVKLPGEEETVCLSVDAKEKGVDISAGMYGIFFEDINYAADGGIYSEVVKNRSFEAVHCNPDKNEAYTPIPSRGWTGVGLSAKYPTDDSLNENNPTYARISARPNGSFSNDCYGGFSVKNGESFNVSFFARGSYAGDVTVSIVEGSRVLGSVTLGGFGEDFKKYSGVIKAASASDNATVKLTFDKTGTIDLDMVSVMSQNTYNGRENGLRRDIVQKLADMHPGFVRFPGGCVAEGYYLNNRYNWKDSVGPVEERKANWNRWQTGANAYDYCQSLGLGFYEYFLLCEDIGAKPLPVLSAGIACQYQSGEVSSWDELRSVYIQDALDLIEFANGDPDENEWAKIRAEMGHPEPFGLEYIGIGNEQWNTEGNRFFERYEEFEKAIHEKYPDIKLISTAGPASDGTDFTNAWNWLKSHNGDDDFTYAVDEHYYKDSEWFLSNAGRYDSYDRNGFSVFAGEYAAHGDYGGKLYAALSEAAFMTGLEKNADIVKMAAYAPLLAKEGFTQWTPDLIWFDNTGVYGSPSYYVQSLYANNSGTYTLDTALDAGASGIRAGVGTWRTAASFKNITVTDNLTGETTKLSPSGGTGDWSASGGTVSQSDTGFEGAFSTSPVPYSDYTLELDAMKTSGSEGFLILFNYIDKDNYLFWNIGGWNNTESAIQKVSGGYKTTISESAKGGIQSGVWYKIKIEVKGGVARCYLDGNLIHTQEIGAAERTVYSSASFDEESGDIILKIANPSENAVKVDINIENAEYINPAATVFTLSGKNKSDTNSFENPEKISTKVTTFDNASENFTYDMDALSFVVIRLHTKKIFAVSAKTQVVSSTDDLPETVEVLMSDGTTENLAVNWRVPSDGAFAFAGEYEIEGKIAGEHILAKAAVEAGKEYFVRIEGNEAVFFASSPAKAVLAIYSADGILINTQITDFEGKISVAIPENAPRVKAFVWDENMKPLADAAEK